MTKYGEIIAEKVKGLLASHGLTQDGFAKEVGISQPKVSAILKGRLKNPTLKTLEQIARRFGLEAHSLLIPEGAGDQAEADARAIVTAMRSLQQHFDNLQSKYKELIGSDPDRREIEKAIWTLSKPQLQMTAQFLMLLPETKATDLYTYFIEHGAKLSNWEAYLLERHRRNAAGDERASRALDEITSEKTGKGRKKTEAG